MYRVTFDTTLNVYHTHKKVFLFWVKCGIIENSRFKNCFGDLDDVVSVLNGNHLLKIRGGESLHYYMIEKEKDTPIMYYEDGYEFFIDNIERFI